MKINNVTITGADTHVPHERLTLLQSEFPFVEWGILFSSSKQGEERYPLYNWVQGLRDKGLRLSAHLCGDHARQVLEHHDTSFMDAKKDYFQRFQLNYNFSYNDKWSFAPLVEWCENNRANAVILQYNKSNKRALNDWLAQKYFPSNIHVLYDSSGGRGTEIKDLDGMMPFHGYYTGYAGGLSQTNVEAFCKDLMEVEFKDNVWIDMESGVRTYNKFDIMKVATVLTIVRQFNTINADDKLDEKGLKDKFISECTYEVQSAVGPYKQFRFPPNDIFNWFIKEFDNFLKTKTK